MDLKSLRDFYIDRLFNNNVAGGFGHDIQGAEDVNPRLNQHRQGPGELCDRDFQKQRPENRYL